MKTILIPVEYICGHLRYGHLEATLEDDEFEKFINSETEEEKREIIDKGDPHLVVDDYRVDDYGGIDYNDYSVC